jgi:cohesin domain-containing protein/dockerin type I repeat protein
LALGLALAAAAAQAATIDLGEIRAEPGETSVTIPIVLTNDPGDEVAALQVDVDYSDSVLALVSVDPGPTAEAAAKEVVFNPLDADTLRVIVAGFNQNLIADGVVAYLVFNVKPEAPDGVHILLTQNLLVSDAFGGAVPSQGLPGSVIVGHEQLEDVNVDGFINAVDVQLAIKALLGLDIFPYTADADEDTLLNAVDLQLVINAALGS